MFSRKKQYFKERAKYVDLRKKLVEERSNLESVIDILHRSISVLKLKKHNLGILVGLDEKCTLCVDVIKETDGIGKLGCGHTFHINCLQSLVLLSDQYDRCPNCRKSFEVPNHYDIFLNMKKEIKILEERNVILLGENINNERRISTALNKNVGLKLDNEHMRHEHKKLKSKYSRVTDEMVKLTKKNKILKTTKNTELFLQNEELRLKVDKLEKDLLNIGYI